jgi:predicted secreted protein
MFGQIYNDRWPWVAPISIGIGIRGDSRATLFMGSALRLGTHASVTGGVAIGAVSALPAGTVEGRAVIDTNVLSNLITRTTHSWFAGVTYTFASLR